MALYKAQGIVLRTRNLGEADKIATLFTHERGKVDAVARGVRRPRSQFVGVTQAFTHGRFLLYEGKSDLDTLRQGEIIGSFAPLRENLQLMAYASYAGELVDRTTELKDPHPDVFAALLAVQELLAAAGNAELAMRWFELQLLERLGFRPHLESCVQCGAAGGPWVFSVRWGGLLCFRCGSGDPDGWRMDGETLEVMRFLATAPASRLGVVKPTARAMDALDRMLPAFCALRIGRPLHSYQFLQSLRGVQG